MATRRTIAPRKRSAPSTVAVTGDYLTKAVDDAEDDARRAEDAAELSARRQLLDKFEASLRDNRDLDDEGRDYLMQHYRNAVETAPIAPALDPTAKPDRRQWIDALDGLRSGGVVTDDDASALIRQFDAAMERFDSPELLALSEFAERCEREGQAAAVAWLESRRSALEESKRATAAATQDVRLQPAKPAMRRTRSPRGPPS